MTGSDRLGYDSMLNFGRVHTTTRALVAIAENCTEKKGMYKRNKISKTKKNKNAHSFQLWLALMVDGALGTSTRQLGSSIRIKPV